MGDGINDAPALKAAVDRRAQRDVQRELTVGILD
jgi:hypothetical protein